MLGATTRAAAALSTEADSGRAALEVARTVSRRLDGADPHWCVAFATDHHRAGMSRLLDTLSSALGTPYVVGGSATGVLVPDREVGAGPALGILAVRSDAIPATPFVFPGGPDGGAEAGAEIGKRLIRSRRGEDLICLWSDPRACRPDRLLHGLRGVLGPVPVVGGSSSVQDGAAGTFQFSGAECLDAAVAGLRLGGPHRRHVTVTHGFRPLGPPWTVTASHGHLLLELDGRPAHRALAERLGRDAAEAPRGSGIARRLVVGLLPAGDEAPPDDLGALPLLAVLEVDPDAGVLGVDAPIEEGRRILLGLRDRRAARDDLRRRLAGVEVTDYRFGLYFSCEARAEGLHGGGGDAGSLAEALPGLPFLGFFCPVEIAPDRGESRPLLHRGVLLLVGEV